MAIRCSAGLLSPARLDLGGSGAALDTGPRTRAEGDGVQVEVEVVMRGRAPGGGAVEGAQAAGREEGGVEEVVARGGAMGFETAKREGGGGGAGGGRGGGGGRLEEMDRVEVAEPSKEREWVKPRLAVLRVPG